ncbi:MAG: hypothetical protein JXA33_07005 [Anaerolineae bacterium]|nr:hypothetical protein [Anaerolineae bacterium]
MGVLAVGCGRDTSDISPEPPDYADDGCGVPVFRGPYLQRDVHIAAFLLPADSNALRQLCAARLNTPAGDKVCYLPLASYVLLVYAEMQVQSLDDRDGALGWMRETEVGVWIPTLAQQQIAGVRVPTHLAWFLPYLFVDNPHAIATGREVYGFPKTWGECNQSVQIQQPEFTLKVWGFEEFAPEAEGKPYPLLSVQAADVSPSPSGGWPDWDTARAALFHQLFASWVISENQVPSSLWLDVMEHTPLVFLKQFRDASQSHKACYQAIVEAPLHITAFYGGGLIDQRCQLTFHSLSSHPLPDVLGLPVDTEGSLEALATFWLHLDFTLDHGVEVWRA